MGNKYSLSEYSMAKDVVKLFPKIDKILDTTYKELYSHQEYLAVSHVLDAISDSKEMIKRQYSAAKKTLEKKGKE